MDSTTSARRSSSLALIRSFSWSARKRPNANTINWDQSFPRWWRSTSEGEVSLSPISTVASPISWVDDHNPKTHSAKHFTLSDDTSDTDILSSVASSSSPSSTSYSHTPAPRPTLVRRNAQLDLPHKRFSLAIALTDDAISDEVLVEELERMCIRRSRGEDVGNDDFEFWNDSLGGGIKRVESDLMHDCGGNTRLWPETNRHEDDSIYNGPAKIPYTPSLPSFSFNNHPQEDFLSAPAWQSARHVLLTCRELVRTERHYLTALQSLAAGETDEPPPPLMLQYTRGLVDAAEGLLRRLEEDPSARGVAVGFLAMQDVVEYAFVGWCGVVGLWFEGEFPRKATSAAGVLFRRRTGSFGPGARACSGSSMDKGLGPPAWGRSFLTRSLSLKKASRGSSGENSLTTRRRPLVRDLAILPTQRIMRYVLIYRDLLEHTPSTAPSRALIERAVEAARRIAKRCDWAQGNAVFDGKLKAKGNEKVKAAKDEDV